MMRPEPARVAYSAAEIDRRCVELAARVGREARNAVTVTFVDPATIAPAIPAGPRLNSRPLYYPIPRRSRGLT